jgi:hypothetical protein
LEANVASLMMLDQPEALLPRWVPLRKGFSDT